MWFQLKVLSILFSLSKYQALIGSLSCFLDFYAVEFCYYFCYSPPATTFFIFLLFFLQIFEILRLFLGCWFGLFFFFLNVGLQSYEYLCSTVFAVYHRFGQLVFLLLLVSKNLYLFLICYLVLLLLNSMLFSFHILEVFSIFFFWFSIFMALWSNEILCTIPIYVNFHMFELCLSMWSILKNVLCALENSWLGGFCICPKFQGF